MVHVSFRAAYANLKTLKNVTRSNMLLLRSQVSILINNAGMATGMKFLNTPDKLIIRTMDVNIMSHFWVSGDRSRFIAMCEGTK